ncbi:hypothetical protein [Paraburkholderia caribensis]|uniref:hypothetical protein n=1 Tax=Paraburkholderia caribensis TaxID=75105 RepID=UPI001D074452|nr:hypothetical protein [Paraburkholderia caribensis]
MPCTPFRFPDGTRGIVCTRGRKRVHRCSVDGCNAPSGFQCDFRTRQGKTCDRHLCAVHAHQIGSDVHLCPTHMLESSGKRQVQSELF